MDYSKLRRLKSQSTNKNSLFTDAQNSAVGSIAKAYELALKQREFEISQLTSRNNFFMIFQGVLIAGLIQSGGSGPGYLIFFVCLAGVFISAFQTGIASGAKYWQIRWESAVKELEIQLLEHLSNKKNVIQLFSADANHLSERELNRIKLINKTEMRKNDLLSVESNFFDNMVSRNLGNPGLFGKIPKYLIRKRFSVSKIPIWAGIILFLFWIILWNYTFTVHGKHVSEWIFQEIQCINFLSEFSFKQWPSK